MRDLSAQEDRFGIKRNRKKAWIRYTYIRVNDLTYGTKKKKKRTEKKRTVKKELEISEL